MKQSEGRTRAVKIQIQLLKMARENEKLKEKIEELERENSQKTIDWLFPGVDKKDAE